MNICQQCQQCADTGCLCKTNVWYADAEIHEPLTTFEKVICIAIVGWCAGLLYGAVRFYWEILK